MKRNFLVLAVSISVITSFYTAAYAARKIPEGQSMGSTLREYDMRTRQKKIEDRLRREEPVPPRLDAPVMQQLPDGEETVYVRKVSLNYRPPKPVILNDSRVRALVRDLQGAKASMERLKKTASGISDVIEENYLRAYIPEQSLDNNILFINIVRE